MSAKTRAAMSLGGKLFRVAMFRATLFGVALVSAAFHATTAFADDRRRDCADGQELVLVNGRIHTMDRDNRIVSAVTIRNGKIAEVGHDRGGHAPDGCRQVVDLQRRTVIPGIVDNHNHILLLGLRPGYHTPIEIAASFADMRAIVQARARRIPAGAFITSIGGFNPVQFAEKRLPTLAEMNAISPGNPYYAQVAFIGPSSTNSAGKAFFESRGVAVGADGSIAVGAPTVAALNALRAVHTFDDKKRGTEDAMAYAAALGVTTHFDMGGFLIPGSPNHADEFVFDGAASWDPYTAYDPVLDLHRAGKMKVRVRVFFLTMDNAPDVPILSQRLQNAFREFGDDWLRTAGLGEFITNWPLFGPVSQPVGYPTAVRKAAERGWIYQQHTLSSAEDHMALTVWEALNQQIPLAPLRWSIAHAVTITPTNVQRLKALGGGLALHGFRYLAGTPTANGPPYRMALDSGIKVGVGSDSAQISTLNPWLMLYYITTGRNSSGVLINEGQTLTRHEALRLYTAENGWFSKEEDKLGSIEKGKLGDLVVLSDDYFAVSDEALKRLHSVMTVVGGRIVHNTGALRVHER